MSIAGRKTMPQPEPVLLEGCTIIDCTEAGKAVTDGAVLMEDGRIRAVGRRSDVVSDSNLDAARRVDASGSYVLPGLWDAHAHLGGVVPPYEAEYAHESTAHHMIRCIRKAQDNLRSGVTTLRSLGEQNDGDIVLRNAVDAGEIEGPRIFAAGDMMWSRLATGKKEFRQGIRRLIAKDVDLVKLLSSGGIPWRSDTIGRTLHSYEELSAAVREAHSWNKPVAVHGMGDDTIIAAARAGADSVEHGFVVTEKGIQAMAEAGTMFCPNLAVTVAWDPAELAARGYPDWFVANAREAAEHHHEMAAEAIRLGVPILAGVDNLPEGKAPVGAEMHDGAIALLTELKLISGLGLGNGGALLTATRNAAQSVYASDYLGTLERGKLADVIVLNGNPLDDLGALADLRSVWKGGREIRLVPGLEPGWQGGGFV
jgi:imidazolonepropionase-like amidohydrolase